jgi:hypothetical protein
LWYVKSKKGERKMTIKIVENNGKIAIDSPYNARFVSKIKAAGAKWNATGKTWDMDSRSIETAREILREVYGMDDRPPTDLVDVRVATHKDLEFEQRAAVLFGRTIARAWGRDTGAKVGDGVSFIEGRPTSGGSMKNWITKIRKGSVIEIFDVPKSMLENLNPEVITVEIIKHDGKINRAALESEREKLLARLAEIETILAQE